MSTEKVLLSLDAALLAEARQRARDSTLAAYVNQGLHRHVLADSQSELLDDWEKEFGPIPDEALAEMRARWPD